MRYLHEVMIGPSDWSRAERELLAAFVSNLNRCRFCVGIHTGTATILGGRPISPDLLDAWRDAGFDARVGAAFAMLEALAAQSGNEADAIATARAAGLTDAAITDALSVAFAFNLINRLADALGFSFEDEDRRLAEARALVRISYKVPSYFLA